MTRFLEPTRERFLVAIAASLPPERFIELHFFSPIRQSGVESGVAVIAAHPERVEEIIVADAPPSDEAVILSEASNVKLSEASNVKLSEASNVILSAAKDLLESVDDPDSAPEGPAPEDDEADPSSLPLGRKTEERYTVYSARYKLILKGPDRGKWECSVVAEADAPLVTVQTVVRGVQRRSGDAEEPERMSGDDARNYLLAAAR